MTVAVCFNCGEMKFGAFYEDMLLDDSYFA